MPKSLINKAKKQLKRGLRGLKKVEGELLLAPQAENYLDLREEWDILILLDGCRYDLFAQLLENQSLLNKPLKGTLTARISPGSCTPDWGKNTLTKKYKDIVYLSANPFISDHFLEKWGNPNPFYKLIEIWDRGWDKKLKTVRPEVVTTEAKKTLKKYPHKKQIWHYMQPHHPFIGDTKIDEYGWQPIKKKKAKKKVTKKSPPPNHVYELLKKGKITREQAWQAYRDNLVLAIKNIQKELLPLLKNKRVVMTSDHGNCFGIYDLYGHPKETFTRELIEVPWFKLI